MDRTPQIQIPHGSRLNALYATNDLRIAELEGFVCDVAAALARGAPLAGAVRAAAAADPSAASAFEIPSSDEALEAEFGLKEELLFAGERLPVRIGFERGDARLSLELDGFLAKDLGRLLELCGSGIRSASEIRDAIDEPVATVFEALLENDILVTGPPAPSVLPMANGPAVTRLQHAGLLFRGREAGILVDPHLHSAYEPPDLRSNVLRSQLEGLVDAIVISHGHEDHWHLPTIMSFPKDTLIVVPRVTRPSILSPDFAGSLRALGFTRVSALGWWDPPVRVGDLELHVLPFYGEQPLVRERPRHPDLRSWGNTYVVRHRDYTTWFLIDSGTDWDGGMVEVAADVKNRFGTVDLVLSNLRRFHISMPLYITGGHFWLSLTPDQLRRFHLMKSECLTLAPEGVAEVCRRVGARTYLPYAHWWAAIGEHAEGELDLSRELGESLVKCGAATEIVPWRVGDSFPLQ